jgi:DNA adenine methylase
MNIVILDLNQRLNAQYYCDKHVVKQITEFNQLLSSVYYFTGYIPATAYKLYGKNHPCAKWFGGYAGIVHTKIDTYRNYYEEAVKNLLKQKDDIKDIKFISTDYLTLNETKMKNWVIYCDPPYQDTTKYNNIGFEYDVFWQWVRDTSKNNFVFVSEYNAPKDFKCVWSKVLTTTLDKSSRSTATEKLFTYNSNMMK